MPDDAGVRFRNFLIEEKPRIHADEALLSPHIFLMRTSISFSFSSRLSRSDVSVDPQW